MRRERLERLLRDFARVRVAIVGDFYLDRYLVTDPALCETSLETGLTARQVVARRSSPGHAGTVTGNLRTLGVSTIYAVGVTGEDGEGYELRQGLAKQGVDLTHLASSPEIPTGTYMKPTVLTPGGGERELERLDLRSRRPLPQALEASLIHSLRQVAGTGADVVDAVVVADQVEERNHGAVTDAVRQTIRDLARSRPDLVWFADSRWRIGEYCGLALKPNREECLRAMVQRPDGPVGQVSAVAGAGPEANGLPQLETSAKALAIRAGRPVFLTLAAEGMLVVEPDGTSTHIPALPLAGPVDPTGAGDATTAGIVPALALGATNTEAAAVGTLVASVTVRKLGTTGTATPVEVIAALSGLSGCEC